jgi:uncharacterized protein YdeI (YjbR/CyaY-like superfamily)
LRFHYAQEVAIDKRINDIYFANIILATEDGTKDTLLKISNKLPKMISTMAIKPQ